MQGLTSIFSKFKIPTLLGLAIILIGTGTGVWLVSQKQDLTANAGPDQVPQQITISNIQDQNVSISWTTRSPSSEYVAYGITNPSENTAIDVRDSSKTGEYTDHYVNIPNLTPKTTYQFKIVSGKDTSGKPLPFTTASSSLSQGGLQPVIGSVVDKNNKPLTEGFAYLTIPGATLQSSQVSPIGSFTIPLAKVYKTNLSEVQTLDSAMLVSIKISSPQGIAQATFPLSLASKPLPTLKIGDNLQLSEPSPTPYINPDLLIYDLNSDGSINTSDYSIILRNFGKSPKEPRADINKDGIVDQKDVDLMSQKIKQTSSQSPL